MRRRHAAIPVSLCMAAVLSLGFPVRALAGSPEFSRSAEEWARLRDDVLEYEEIEDLIHEYNTTVLNNEQQYRKDSGKTAEDLVEDLLNQADDHWEAASQSEDDMSAILSEINARNAERSAENNVDDSKSKYIEYALAEKRIVIQAQTAMNTYYKLQYQLTSLRKNRDMLEAALTSAQGRRTVGMATQAEVLTAQQNLQSADAQILSLENQIETTRQNMIVMMGWGQGAFPEIRPMPATDLQRLDAMDVAADTQKALEADYTLKLHQQNLENSTNDENRRIYSQSITDDRQQIAMAVSDSYQKVMQAKNSLDEAVLNLDVATKTWNTASTKNRLGTISRLEYLQAEAAVVSAQMDREMKNLELFQAMETYDWVVKGVRS
ncbi:MAG: TolC family protein [Hungatella sp.]|nr:TolC family protein [Hungatella sp.]